MQLIWTNSFTRCTKALGHLEMQSLIATCLHRHTETILQITNPANIQLPIADQPWAKGLWDLT